MGNKWTDIDPQTGKTFDELWNDGWKAGKVMAESLGRPVKTEDFPKDFSHRGGTFWCGYAEGVISGNHR